MSDQKADSYGMTPSLRASLKQHERVVINRMRQLPPWQKLDMVFKMMAEVHAMQVAETRRRLPDATDEEIRDRVAARWIGRELVERVQSSRKPG
jgi:hypothetical protein